MEGYKCDGCREWVEGEPMLTLYARFTVFGEAWPKTFHDVVCVRRWAEEYARQ